MTAARRNSDDLLEDLAEAVDAAPSWLPSARIAGRPNGRFSSQARQWSDASAMAERWPAKWCISSKSWAVDSIPRAAAARSRRAS